MITCRSRPEGVSRVRGAIAGLALVGGIALMYAGCGDDGGNGANLTEVNQKPVAVLGQDMQVAVGETVTMDGSQSSDPDGDQITYSWSFSSLPATSNATLSSTTASSTSFVADVAGDFTVGLTVSDGELTSDGVECTATATNTVPVADAGPDQDVTLGDLVQLDGSQSSDPNGDDLTYSWTFASQPGGSAAVLSSATVADPTFTADVAGEFVVELTVSDGDLTSNPDQTTISVNTPPVADAGTDQNVQVGSLVQLDGSQSSDADGDALTYTWSMESRPAGSAATLSSTSVVDPTFTADLQGDYVVELTVSDGKVSSDPASVVVHSSQTPMPGYYEGTTSQGREVHFTVSVDGFEAEVDSGFTVEFTLDCIYCTGWFRMWLNISRPITAGSFSYDGSSLDFSGTMTSETSFTGTARGYPNAPGCMCSWTEVTWTASWQSDEPPPLVAGAAGEAESLGVGEERLRIEGQDCVTVMQFLRKPGSGN
jgi:hypothetical protein